MKTDEEIARDVAALAPIVGPTHAQWYAEACRVEIGEPGDLWACRLRMAVHVHARDLGELAQAAHALLEACSQGEGSTGAAVQEAIQMVKKALWWEQA